MHQIYIIFAKPGDLVGEVNNLIGWIEIRASVPPLPIGKGRISPTSRNICGQVIVSLFFGLFRLFNTKEYRFSFIVRIVNKPGREEEILLKPDDMP